MYELSKKFLVVKMSRKGFFGVEKAEKVLKIPARDKNVPIFREKRIFSRFYGLSIGPDEAAVDEGAVNDFLQILDLWPWEVHPVDKAHDASVHGPFPCLNDLQAGFFIDDEGAIPEYERPALVPEQLFRLGVLHRPAFAVPIPVHEDRVRNDYRHSRSRRALRRL